MSKASYIVNHDILLKKLEHYGIRGLALDWFKSYLSNRKQFTQIQNINSNLHELTTGVPQGSVLGPLLFLIYVNDIANAVKNIDGNIMLFADDTNVFVIGKDIYQLKKDTEVIIYELCIWFKTNKLTLNLDKTNYSIFHPPRKKIPHNCNTLTIGETILNRVDNVRYLGVYLEDMLNWKTQIGRSRF